MKRLFLPLIVIGALVLGLWAAITPVNVSFNVDAVTEIISGVTNGRHSASWYFRQDTVYDGCDGTNDTISGQILLNENVHVKLIRIGHGALWGRLTNQDGSSVGDLKDETDTVIRSLKDCVDIRLNQDVSDSGDFKRRILLPIQGQFDVGENVLLGQVSPQIPLLQKGTIHLLGRRLIGEGNYEAGRFPLSFGDTFVVDDPVGESFALVEVFDKPALRVIYRVQTATARINRFGAEPLLLKVNLWTRLKNDPVVTIPWLILATALGVYLKLHASTQSSESEGAEQ